MITASIAGSIAECVFYVVCGIVVTVLCRSLFSFERTLTDAKLKLYSAATKYYDASSSSRRDSDEKS